MDNDSKISNWYFTFGFDQKYANYYVKIKGTWESTRETMFEHFGRQWAFQYPEEDFERAIKHWNLEELII